MPTLSMMRATIWFEVLQQVTMRATMYTEMCQHVKNERNLEGGIAQPPPHVRIN
jgi:hypothetical protein